VGKKDNQSGSKNQINHSKSVYKTVNSFSSNVTGGKDFKLLTELKCVYTNADSFMNKFDEFRTRFINDESDPHFITITEALPKNGTGSFRPDIFKFQVFINKKNQSNIVGQLTKQCVLFKEILRIFAMVLKWYFPYFIF
jgi:hypothetical protein